MGVVWLHGLKNISMGLSAVFGACVLGASRVAVFVFGACALIRHGW